MTSIPVPAAIHLPVMASEVFSDLMLSPGQIYVDGTLGLGGHAAIAAQKLTPGGTIIGFDWDESMLTIAKARLSNYEEVRFQYVHSDYRGIRSTLKTLGVEAHGILLDLGLNSAQIDDPARGIAFREAGPLDMRMNQSAGETAADLLNRLDVNEIERILWNYGDERWARAIAKQIVEQRRETPLETTADLVDAVLAAVPPGARDKRIHPATRTFQAIRIEVNRELAGLEEAITDAAHCLTADGTLVVLSYHSGEDRAAKQSFRALSKQGFIELNRKPTQPGAEEIARNPRSRSAKLRSLRRVTGDPK